MKAVSGSASASFVYDGDGQRVKGVVNGATTLYLGDWFEWTGSVNTMKKYYYAGGVRFAMMVGPWQFGMGLRFLFGDHLGSTTLSIWPAQLNAQSRELYLPWGASRYNSNPQIATSFRFTGQRNEALLGLQFFKARWYDPWLGRFLQADTIIPDPGNPLDWDQYAYARNNALRYTDPTGHKVCDEDGNCFDRGKYRKINGRTPFPPPPDVPLSWLGDRAEQVLDYLNSHAGWWNNNGEKSFDVYDLLWMMLFYEYQPLPVDDDVAFALAEAVVRNIYEMCGSNCQGEMTRNAILNYVGMARRLWVSTILSALDNGKTPDISPWGNPEMATKVMAFVRTNPVDWQNGAQIGRPYTWGNSRYPDKVKGEMVNFWPDEEKIWDFESSGQGWGVISPAGYGIYYHWGNTWGIFTVDQANYWTSKP